MNKGDYKKIIDQLWEIRAELFKMNHPPKFKIGEEVLCIGYGIEQKKITHIDLISYDLEWYYSFGVSQDWTPEGSIKSIKEINDENK